MRKPAVALAAAACTVALVSTPAAAQSTAATGGGITVLARGLNGPREVSASHGRLYVAEADTGRITAIDPRTGAKRTVVTGLANPQGVVRVGGRLYIATGDASPDAAPSAGPAAAILVARPGHRARRFADLLAYELAHNPDRQRQFGPDGKPLDTLSNPYYVIRDRSPRGFLLVADAGGNDVLRLNRRGRVSTFFVPPTIMTGACATVKNNNASGKGCDSVPTGLAYGPHHTLYVSALTSEVPDEGRVYVVNSRTGRLLRTIKGFSGPTGVAVDRCGTVYVSEVLQGAPEGNGPPPPGFDPRTVGQIVRVTRSGQRRYAQVTMPSGLLYRHGRLYASAWAVASFLHIKNAGQVVTVSRSAFAK